MNECSQHVLLDVIKRHSDSISIGMVDITINLLQNLILAHIEVSVYMYLSLIAWNKDVQIDYM